MAAGSNCRKPASTDALRKVFRFVQGDADTDLVDYPDDAYLTTSFYRRRCRRRVTPDASWSTCCASGDAIVSFPNFGHWRVRAQLMFQGRMPQTNTLSYSWYDTPNIHLCTIRDFVQLVDDIGRRDGSRHCASMAAIQDARQCAVVGLNPFGEQAVFLLTARNPEKSALSVLGAFDRLENQRAGIRGIAPTREFDPLSGFEIL